MTQSVNLYPQDMRPRQDVLTLTQLAASCLGILVLVMLGSWYAAWHATVAVEKKEIAETQLAQARKAVAAADERLQRRVNDPSLIAELEQLRQILANQEGLLQQVKHINRQSEQGFSDVMLGLSRQAVDGVWLTHLEIDRETGALALAGLTENGSLVPRYLEQLRSETAFAGRRFRYFRLDRPEDDSRILAFRIAAQVQREEHDR